MSTTLLDLPNDALRSVALHLDTPDVLSFLSTHREFSSSLGTSTAFWKELTYRDFDVPLEQDNNNDGGGGNNDGTCWQKARQDYMTKAYVNHLPSAQWYPIRRSPGTNISSREGHIACVLPGPDNEQRVVVTGGFSEDETVYMMRAPPRKNCQDTPSSWSWTRLIPGNSRPSFTYGASLTPLKDAIMEDGCHIARAIRFGGFKAGGYSHEVNEVWLLTIRSEPNNSDSSYPWRTSVSWESVPTTNPQYGAPRAYHTATLVGGRYLVVLGGMMWRESILGEAILDTQTWTWITDPVSTFGNDKPSGRHGHSTILDNRRNRLLLFGGGSGTDLLRSGNDNSEVWELKMNDDWKANLALPWRWSKVHQDSWGQSESDGNENDEDSTKGEESDSAMRVQTPPTLSPAETLCIGRCHHGIKITPNTAVFLFGSGRPSTNGVIGYDLRNDCFVRPDILGPLPTPRFSGVAAYLESEGYLVTQGGYSSQQSDCIDDVTVLDLAPFMKREFTSLPVDGARRPHRSITDEDAENARMNRFGGNMFEQHQFLSQMISWTRGGLISAEELEGLLRRGGIVSNNGIVVVGEGDNHSYHDDDNDDDDEH